MADVHGIREALDASISSMLALEDLVSSFEVLSADGTEPPSGNEPPWIRCLRRAFDQAEASREALECVIRRQVL